MSEFSYVGEELEIFSEAKVWKYYWSSVIGRHISGSVLEVGAGIGSNIEVLHRQSTFKSWCCLEPDEKLLNQLRDRYQLAHSLETFCGTVGDLPIERKFDAILYIDVLEHLEDDRAELNLAAAHLNPGGRLIVLSPAHNLLYSPFDKAIGHFRRYNRNMLKEIRPLDLIEDRIFYLDSVGMMASMTNCLVAKQSMPTKWQILLWDWFFVRLSRWIDPLTLRMLGKTVIAIWRK